MFRHRARLGGSTAFARLGFPSNSSSAKANEPLGQAQGRKFTIYDGLGWFQSSAPPESRRSLPNRENRSTLLKTTCGFQHSGIKVRQDAVRWLSQSDQSS